MKSSSKSVSLSRLVTRFLGEMHRFDAGRTLPLLHAARLTTPQLAALEFVIEPRTISTVASYLGLSQQATSQMIHKLVRRGLIRRSEGVVDRREKAVVLTPKGKAHLVRIASARSARFERSLSALPKRAASRLKGALREALLHMEAKVPASKRRARPR